MSYIWGNINPPLTTILASANENINDQQDPIQNFISILLSSLNNDEFQTLSLSNNILYNNQSIRKEMGENPLLLTTELKKVNGRIVAIKAGKRLQLTYKYKTNDIFKNYELQTVVLIIQDLLTNGFKNAIMITNNEQVELDLINNKIKFKKSLNNSRTTSNDNNNLHNNREKEYMLPINEAFLLKLDITTIEYKSKLEPIIRVKTGMNHKFKQIQKFIEILSNLITKSNVLLYNNNNNDNNLKIVDMGCGLGYLTFATHIFLTKYYDKTINNFQISTVGIEMRDSLVIKTNEIVSSLGIKGLIFKNSNIIDEAILSNNNNNDNNSKNNDKIDILIALHACDTATDDAIWNGIIKNAEIIIISPCCHKEIRKQIDQYYSSHSFTKNEDYSNLVLLESGIYRERLSEMITDSIRSLLLQYMNYDTNIIEFISSTETSKNTMITAIKQTKPFSESHKNDILLKLTNIMNVYGIKQHRLLELLEINLIDKQLNSNNGSNMTRKRLALRINKNKE
eukprot:gene12608-16903_t